MLYPDFNELIALKRGKSRSEISSNHSQRSTIAGDYRSPFRGQGLEFDSVREYVLGDDIRNIDWKVTARTNSPHLKLFKEDRERQVIISVNQNASMRFGTRHTFKSVQAARAAAWLGWKALSQKSSLGACLFGDVPEGMQFFSPKRTRASLWAMFKLLSKQPLEKNYVTLEKTLKHLVRACHTGSLVYIISDFMDLEEGAHQLLARLNQRCDVVLISVNDPVEMVLPAAGTLAFRCNHTEKIWVNTDDVTGKDAYSAQWIKNRELLHQLSCRLKISVVQLTTESDMANELSQALRMITRRRAR